MILLITLAVKRQYTNLIQHNIVAMAIHLWFCEYSFWSPYESMHNSEHSVGRDFKSPRGHQSKTKKQTLTDDKHITEMRFEIENFKGQDYREILNPVK